MISVEFENEKIIMKPSETKTNAFYVFGDSITKGIVFNEEKMRYEKSPKNFIALLAEQKDYICKNFSKFGATIEHGLSIFSRKEKELGTEGVAIIEFGGNDCDFLWPEVAKDPEAQHDPNTILQAFHERYLELIQKLRAKGLEPIVLNLPPLDAERFFETISKGLDKENILRFLGGRKEKIFEWQEMYSKEVQKIAQESKTKLIDLRSFLLEAEDRETLLCRDGMHLNEKGHQVVAKALAKLFP